MFADNQQISRLQAERQFLLAYFGPAVLWIVTGTAGRGGLVSMLIGSALLCLWTFFLLRQAHVYRSPERYWGSFMSKVIALGFQAYLILTGGWLVAKISGILTEYLVQGISWRFAAALLVLAALGGCHHVQARGRFAQTAWPMVRFLVLAMFLLAVFQSGADRVILQNPLSSENGAVMWRKILSGTGQFAAAFLGIGLFPFLQIQTKSGGNAVCFPFRAIVKMTVWLAAVRFILRAGFGAMSAENLEYPVLHLMAGVRISGGFLRRIDLIFLTVILFCLLFSLGSIFFYSKYICERVSLPAGRVPAAVLCFFLGTADFGKWSLVQAYPRLLLLVFLPFFLALAVGTAFVRRRGHGK